MKPIRYKSMCDQYIHFVKYEPTILFGGIRPEWTKSEINTYFKNIAFSPNLSFLSFINCFLSEQDVSIIQHLARVVKNAPKLQQLEWNWQDFRNMPIAHVRLLTDAIKQASHLEIINFRKFTKADMVNAADYDVGYNTRIQLLINAITNHPSLTTVTGDHPEIIPISPFLNHLLASNKKYHMHLASLTKGALTHEMENGANDISSVVQTYLMSNGFCEAYKAEANNPQNLVTILTKPEIRVSGNWVSIQIVPNLFYDPTVKNVKNPSADLIAKKSKTISGLSEACSSPPLLTSRKAKFSHNKPFSGLNPSIPLSAIPLEVDEAAASLPAACSSSSLTKEQAEASCSSSSSLAMQPKAYLAASNITAHSSSVLPPSNIPRSGNDLAEAFQNSATSFAAERQNMPLSSAVSSSSPVLAWSKGAVGANVDQPKTAPLADEKTARRDLQIAAIAKRMHRINVRN